MNNPEITESEQSSLSPDVRIIEHLCQNVVNASINKEILLNWQVELADTIEDYASFASLIAHNVILSVDDINDIDSYSRLPNVEKLLTLLHSLDSELYRDFKIIILEIIIYYLSLSYNLRVRLMMLKFHQFLILQFFDILEDEVSVEEPLELQHDGAMLSVLSQYIRLLTLFFELGSDSVSLKQLISPLYNSSTKPTTKLHILDLLQQVFSKYSSHFNFVIFNKATSFPFINEDLKKNLTIQSWFKINPREFDSDEPLTLFVLTNSSAHSEDNAATTLNIRLINYSQFLIEIKNNHNDSRMQFTFNQILNKYDANDNDGSNNNRNVINQGYTHFALTYDNYANLNLYIDGEYSESIPCPEIYKILSSWNKVYVGSEQNDVLGISSDEIIIKNLTILNVSLSHEWLNLLYNLGLGYDWDFKELTNENLFNLLNHLSFRNLTNVKIKFKELNRRRNESNKSTHQLFGEHNGKTRQIPSSNTLIHRSSRGNLSNNSSSSILPERNSLAEKSAIVKSLAKLKQENILFDTNDFFQTLKQRQKVHSKDNLPILLGPASFIYHDSHSIHGGLYSIGGISLLVNLIETSLEVPDSTTRDTLLYKSLFLLFTILENNWRLCKEFENINGYELLSIILKNYKEKFNPTLTFSLLPEFADKNAIENSTGCHGANLLNLILTYSGFDFINNHDSVIVNRLAYRFLVLDFDLFYGSDSFEYLLYQFQILIHSSKFNEFNVSELTKMKLLKKLLQFLKQPVLLRNPLKDSMKEQLALTIISIIRSDPSVETIRSISLYIIYALYNDDCSSECGAIVLSSLTDFLCEGGSSIKTLKKFSRSITIHWILLLFRLEKSKDVALSGLRLLTRLLKTLGSHIIKRFFLVNRGLDILTYFLKQWWDDDDILSTLFLASFGVDRDEGINTKSSGKSNKDLLSVVETNLPILSQLVIPDFLLLLNNLALNSMYSLSMQSEMMLGSNPSSPRKVGDDEKLTLCLNVLHLTNEYADAISIGYERNKSLRAMCLSKEFIEGISELLGYFHLSLGWASIEVRGGFKSAFEKLTTVIAQFFISNLGESTLIGILEGLSDFTKKMIFEIVFPKIFEHINQFVNVSNFIFNERQFVDSAIYLLNYYNQEFVKQNYYIRFQDIDTYITSMASIVEVGNDHAHIKKIKKQLGETIVLKFCTLASEEIQYDDSEVTRYIDTVKTLLYRQITILNPDILDDRKLGEIVTLMLGLLLKFKPEEQAQGLEYTFSFLRTTYLMNQDQFSKVIANIDADAKLLAEFFTNLVTRNDEETFTKLQKYPPFIRSLMKNFQSLIVSHNRIDLLKTIDMIKVTLHNGGKLGQMNSIYIKSFEKDCELLKALIINGELIKFNRSIQDHQENVQFFVSNYHLLKLDISRLIQDVDGKDNYILDYIESNDRMRRRLVIEDQIPESEKLSYNIDVPLKKLDPIESGNYVNLQDYDYAIAANGIDTLSLSTDNSILLDPADESFDISDDNQDTSAEEVEARSAYEDKNRKVLRSLFMGDQILALWNISQVNGLVPIESLMILGSSHLYLIENYFHCQDGNVIDVQDAPPEERDPILHLVNSQSDNVLRSDSRSHRNKSWSLDKLSSISKRQFLLRDIALEMFFSDGASILITCLSPRNRDSIYGKLHSYATGRGLDSDLAQALQYSSSTKYSSSSLMTSNSSSFTSRLASAFASSASSLTSSFVSATRKWRMGEMSNFYYLMIINTLAGRTFNDLTQYPVFPWVIADYSSDTLDLSDPRSFRDLSKPMGAQTHARAQQFQDRYEALDSLNDHDAPAFHYGTHYSSAMIVTSFLIRLKPYVQSYLLLQGGKFDHADRLFNSVEKAWLSASKDNTTDVRELTPEFYYLPEFLVNSNNFEFGTFQNGESANDVVLPPWAKGDPKIFIAKNREALESSYVSANLHLWIDLVFGFKQSGPEAVSALNVFHHLSYNGATNLDNIKDEIEKRAVIGMINNFGQTPLQIFDKPHVQKDVLNVPNYYLNLVDKEKGPKLLFESKLKMPIQKLEISLRSNKKWVGRPACVSSEDELLIRKANDFKYESGSLIINKTTFLNIHLSNLSSLLQIGNKQLLTGSEDGIINAWKCELRPNISLQFQAILRGHLSEVKSLKLSDSYKLALSLDVDGIVILWDLARFKFIRKFVPIADVTNTRISISNDTGNIGIMYSTATSNTLRIFNVNGELIFSKEFIYEDIEITSFNFGNINLAIAESGKTLINNDHTFWSNEMFAIAAEKTIEIYELNPLADQGWEVRRLDSIDLLGDLKGDITALELLKSSEVDSEDNLCRGFLKLIIGDSTGKVYGM